MTITITAATGQLGRLAVDALIARGVAPEQIVAAVRTPAKAAEIAAKGVQVREADYARPETLAPAFAGTDRLLLISSSEVGQRVAQHANAIEAAKAAGVGAIAYTSVIKADSSGLLLAEEHLATEQLLRDSGLPFTFLRNSWYLENYTAPAHLAGTVERGVLLGAAGDGRVAAATRSDYAEAAAAVLTGSGHEGQIYELGGDEPFTLTELAATISGVAGRPVRYQDLPEADYAKALLDAGVPEIGAKVLSDSDAGIARGELDTDSGDLRRLIGRPTTSPADAVRAGLQG